MIEFPRCVRIWWPPRASSPEKRTPFPCFGDVTAPRLSMASNEQEVPNRHST
jgi:hypothetical protein